jgi:hypothetical protein
VGFEFFVVISLVFFCFVAILFLVAFFLFHLYLGTRRSSLQKKIVRKILDLVVVVAAKGGASKEALVLLI